jgi:hypothetical protein
MATKSTNQSTYRELPIDGRFKTPDKFDKLKQSNFKIGNY